ncbi:hypothetical protein N7468_007872 [Penicillium chermesinum]|uniref:Xylanolytic transcriptional activator regulatory domain-containing protein n=1 Tax=Penicillium chermesinum TaxID=63820 RepID=A0A9W9NNQ3_9EURO|nr:uncharacterized protein N7468_007872 [Penicillium chermesinum]KAJ5223330.1 hypothetical protein N7468_007872 [Penicillium chermesinum]
MNTDANIPISDASFSQGVLSMGALALGYGGLDWLDFQLQEPMINPAQVEHPHPHPIPSEMAAPNSGVVNNFYTPILSHGPLTSTSSPNAVDMLPLKTEFPGHSIQSWPFAQSKDHVPEQPPSRYKLPPLEEVLRGSSTNSHTKSKTPIEALIEILSKPRIPDTSAQDPEIFLGMHLLQRIIDCYFSQFHDILAIIHVPTFSIRDCSTVLLASMACIGAMHLQSADAQADATALCDLCSRMILWLVSCDLPTRYHHDAKH